MSGLGRAARIAQRAGIHVSRHPTYLSIEYHLRELLQRAEVALVIDVGAHRGGFGAMLRGPIGYRGRIISFEPAAEAFEDLRNKADDAWDVQQLAISDTAGTGMLQRYAASDMNSLHEPTDYGRRQTAQMLTSAGAEQVRVERLDSILSELGVDPATQPTMLKIDTQGNDLAVMDGAPGCLAAIDVLQVELSLKHIYKESPEFLPTLSHLLGMGFEPTGFFPVMRDLDMLIAEVDCVMRRVRRI